MNMTKIYTLFRNINILAFNNELPESYIFLTKNRRILGQHFIKRSVSIIHLNLTNIKSYKYSIDEILAHEMTHLWQEENLDIEPKNEHDKVFIDKLSIVCNTMGIRLNHVKDFYI